MPIKYISDFGCSSAHFDCLASAQVENVRREGEFHSFIRQRTGNLCPRALRSISKEVFDKNCVSTLLNKEKGSEEEVLLLVLLTRFAPLPLGF